MRRLLAVLWLLASTACAPGRPPNVLLVTVDTLRADHVGAYGARGAATPVIDALADRGMVVERAFTAVPVTLASHASLLTGRWPPQHGVRGNSFYRLPDGETTLAETLRAAGYRTAAVVGAAVLDHRFGLDQGFDLYDDRTTSGTDTVLIAERDAATVISRALEWIGQPDERPFFLWVHLFDPHDPYRPPKPFATRFAASPYDGEIAYVDREIGRLLGALDERRALARTVVVVTGDHGESLGEHGEATHGVFLYDATLRVPLVFAGPGIPRERRANAVPVSLVDVLPTILARAGLAPPQGVAGRDLLAREPVPRDYVYAETWLPRDFYGWSELSALRSAKTKFISGPQPELYDLVADGGETHDLASARPDDVRRLAAVVAGFTANAPKPAANAVRPADAAALGERLRSLGYVSGAPAIAEPEGRSRPNPKAMIGIVGRMDEVLALIHAGQPAVAVTRLEGLLRDDPTNFLALRTLADALFDLGRNRESTTAYEKVLASGRDDAYFHYRLGLLHERERAFDRAAAEFRLLVRLDPAAVEEIVQRAEALSKRGDARGALAYLEAIAAEGRGGVAVTAAVVDARIQAGRAKEALEAADEALGAHRGEPALLAAKARALNALAAARGDSGDLRGALALLRTASELAPADFETLANLGITEARLGHDEEALRAFARAVAIRPDEVRLLNLSGQIQYRRGDLAAAAELLRRSLAVDPAQPRIAEALQAIEARRRAGR